MPDQQICVSLPKAVFIQQPVPKVFFFKKFVDWKDKVNFRADISVCSGRWIAHAETRTRVVTESFLLSAGVFVLFDLHNRIRLGEYFHN